MKQVATTWTGRNEASISVHPVQKCGNMSVKEQKPRPSWRRERDRARKQLEPL
jgi:hypothetical protein